MTASLRRSWKKFASLISRATARWFTSPAGLHRVRQGQQRGDAAVWAFEEIGEPLTFDGKPVTS
jgi:hypothetical protein